MTLRQGVKENAKMLDDRCEINNIDGELKEIHYPVGDNEIVSFKNNKELKEIIIENLQEFLDGNDFLTLYEIYNTKRKMKELKEL